MSMVHGAGDRRHQPGRGAEVLPEARQFILEAAAVDQLHAEEMLAFVLADFVDLHDVRVIEVARRLGLLAKPLDGIVIQPVRQDHLQRNGPVEADLPAAVDDTHAAAGDLALPARSRRSNGRGMRRRVIVDSASGSGSSPVPSLAGNFRPGTIRGHRGPVSRRTEPGLEQAFRAEPFGSFGGRGEPQVGQLRAEGMVGPPRRQGLPLSRRVPGERLHNRRHFFPAAQERGRIAFNSRCAATVGWSDQTTVPPRFRSA